MRTWLAEGLAPVQDGFLRDLGRLFVVTAVLLTLASLAAAWAVNAYFGKTVAGLIGGAGEFDFMLHVKASAKARALRQLEAYLPKAFPGARLKPGLTVAGQANFFLSLPEELKTRTVLENIDSAFGSIPGYSGHTTLLEPSLNVNGVAPGARGFFLDRLEKLPGVKVAFADGQELVVGLDGRRRPEDVERDIKRLLGEYRLVEVRFPMGYKVPDLRAAGRRVVTAVNRRFGGTSQGSALDATGSGGTDDYRSFLASLTELRRFLLSYTSDIQVKLEPGAALQPGDEVVAGAKLPPQGHRVGSGLLRVLITEVDGQTAHGVAVQGETTPPERATAVSESGVLPAGTAHRIRPGDRVGERLGTVTIHNQRYALMATVDESLKLLDRLQVLAKHADTTAARVELTLDSYQKTLDQIGQAQAALAQVRRGLSGPLDGLGKVPADQIVLLLNQAVAGIDDLLGKMTGVQEAKAAMDLAAAAAARPSGEQGPGQGGPAEAAGVQQSVAGLSAEAHRQTDLLSQIIARINPATLILLKWRAQAQNLALQVGNFGLLAQNAGKVNDLIGGLSKVTDTTLATMQGIDVPALKAELEEISRRLEGIAQIDVASVTHQMRYVRDSLPNLRDEELGRSIRLIDRYIGGDVIPGQRLQLLVPAGLPLAQVAAEARRSAGERATTVVSPAGSVKPDVRGIVFQLLGKVRSTVAGLAAVALVAAALVLDHALVISALRAGWSARRLPRWWTAGAGAVYGAAAGATLLSAVFFLSGAWLPYCGRPAVAALGGALGLVVAALAGRLAPVDSGEFEAGQAMGLSYARLMREIVIPEGRPGLLFLLNRSEMIFPPARTARVARTVQAEARG
ncbi:MAG TPA: hypothetical protein GXX28_06820 [Firmicutes bacterium]|nr:hypothetical protein [Bacillota bacterium]